MSTETPPLDSTLPWIVAIRKPAAERTFAERVQVVLVQQYLFAFSLHHARGHGGRGCLLCAAAIPPEASWFGHGKRAICQACCDTRRPAEVLAPFRKWRATNAYLTADELEAEVAALLRGTE